MKNPFRRKQEKALTGVPSHRGWYNIIREANTGNWQRNIEINRGDAEDFFAIYSCTTLIAGDISKLEAQVFQNKETYWQEIFDANKKLLKRPNHYQSSIQFIQWWLMCKLRHGNVYVLKRRDVRGNITGLYILNPENVTPLISDKGNIFYQISRENINGDAIDNADFQGDKMLVAADDIIHDRYQPLFHPLVGLPPVAYATLSGALGNKIQEKSYKFFQNGGKLSGILSAPGSISEETAKALADEWRNNYSKEDGSDILLVSDGLKFEAMSSNSVDSQLVDQLKLSAEIVCACFHIPPAKLGLRESSLKAEEINEIYYSDCLQVLIEELESSLVTGLECPDDVKIEFKINDLVRMNALSTYQLLGEGVKGGFLTLNEARKEIGLKPLEGGDTVFLQQQNFSLEALAKRDAQENPFGAPVAPPATLPENDAKILDLSQLKLKKMEQGLL